MKLRWNDYFLKKDRKHDEFWKEYLETPRNILYILGAGFDPRMCVGIKSILEKGGEGIRHCALINFHEYENSPSKKFRHNVDMNKEELQNIIKDKAELFEKEITMENDEGHRIGSRKSAKIFQSFADFEKYSDIILDISSLPLNIYLPLLGKILRIIDKQRIKENKKMNLHVIVAENTIIDKSIKKSGLLDRADLLYGFPGNLDIVSNEDGPTVWIPILGEEQELQIKLIVDKINPQEICPVLPSPSANPRRGDDLMLEYRKLIIDKLDIESRNIVYGAEQNPFELYRQIQKTIEHYQDALKPLGKCKFALSSLSSKLMSLGVFFAAYEEGISNQNNVGIVYVESKGYSMMQTDNISIKNMELFSLWISGDCYNE